MVRLMGLVGRMQRRVGWVEAGEGWQLMIEQVPLKTCWKIGEALFSMLC